ncbi:MBL fold metallo-hydrolase [Dethiosulfovibrio sp. F2B]|uniref:MBL fold metallo-hydrolase n=1 Tax=Dethiosulfovibrio faecalis TaxID=2720018 RepID=UPI001F18ACF5|nr:MBL fold metallo-hydrolase [Dethiosulfovibrio faecalis]MCF4151344.1 MBL fold metallo-hydrolase [Dethiosulfovibrio faecalis]
MADLKLTHLLGDSYVVEGRIKLGLWGPKDDTVLLDSGMDESSGRALRRMIEREDRHLNWVACTHFHADHVGGCAYLKKSTGCSVAMPAFESPFLEETIYEPSFLWGASPFGALKNKFLMAPVCQVDRRLPQCGEWEETGLRLVSLAGHSPGMVGYVTPDEVAYVGDSLFDSDMVEAHGMLYVVDVAEWLVTLDFLERLEARWFVPCHASTVEDPSRLISVTRRHLLDISDRVLSLCRTPMTRDDLLGKLMEWLDKKMDPLRYVLNLGALSAHLSYLIDRGEVEPLEDRGRLLWKAVD